MADERWLPIAGYEGLYEVSDRGRVRRLAGTAGCINGRILRPIPMKVGYVAASLCKEGKATVAYVHHLVAHTFLGPVRPGMEINHKDANKANPALSNLEYVTSSGNKLHAVAMGRMPEGERCPWAKLTADEAAYILDHFRPGIDSPKEWGERFHCTAGNIDAIVKRRSWKGLGAGRKVEAA